MDVNSHRITGRKTIDFAKVRLVRRTVAWDLQPTSLTLPRNYQTSGKTVRRGCCISNWHFLALFTLAPETGAVKNRHDFVPHGRPNRAQPRIWTPIFIKHRRSRCYKRNWTKPRVPLSNGQFWQYAETTSFWNPAMSLSHALSSLITVDGICSFRTQLSV